MWCFKGRSLLSVNYDVFQGGVVCEIECITGDYCNILCVTGVYWVWYDLICWSPVMSVKTVTCHVLKAGIECDNCDMWYVTGRCWEWHVICYRLVLSVKPVKSAVIDQDLLGVHTAVWLAVVTKATVLRVLVCCVWGVIAVSLFYTLNVTSGRKQINNNVFNCNLAKDNVPKQWVDVIIYYKLTMSQNSE